MTKKHNLIKDAVTDVCGNTYNAVEIGNRIWMASNLRTKKYRDGCEILRYDDSCMGSLPFFAYPGRLNCFSKELEKYGLFYNHRTLSRGIAPEGWHVPSLAEWKELLLDIANDKDCNVLYDSRFPYTEENLFSVPVAKALSAGRDWKLSNIPNTVGCRKKFNNASGFTAEPSGYFYMSSSCVFGEYAYFLTSDMAEHLDGHSKCIGLGHNGTSPFVSNYPTIVAASIRCVKDY